MNIFIYIIIGIIGALFGSFFTLAVYRLPRGENITYKRSYCPKCGHRLEFFDLIPVLSYIFLGGKCRYCKEPIHPRYILFELFTSLIFILLAFSMNLSIYSDDAIFTLFSFSVLFISVLMINGLINKEGNKISIGVIVFGYLVRSIYLIIYERYNFITYFLITLIYVLIFSLILYILLNRNKNIIEGIFCGLIVYQFGINISIVIMLLTLIYLIFSKYILKQKPIYIYYISVFSIAILMLNNVSYINNILKFRWLV